MPGSLFRDAFFPLAGIILAHALIVRMMPLPLRQWVTLVVSIVALVATKVLGAVDILILAGISSLVYYVCNSVATSNDNSLISTYRQRSAIALLTALCGSLWVACDQQRVLLGPGLRLASAFCFLKWVHLLVIVRQGNRRTIAPLSFFTYLFFLPTFFYGPFISFDQFCRDYSRSSYPAAGEIGRLLHRVLLGLFFLVALPNLLEPYTLSPIMAEEMLAEPVYGQLVVGTIVAFLMLWSRWFGLLEIVAVAALLWGVRIPADFGSPLGWFNPGFLKTWHRSVVSFFKSCVPTKTAERSHSLSIMITTLLYACWLSATPWAVLFGVLLGALVILAEGVASRLAGENPKSTKLVVPGRGLAWLLTLPCVALVWTALSPEARLLVRVTFAAPQRSVASLSTDAWRPLEQVRLAEQEGSLHITSLGADPHLEHAGDISLLDQQGIKVLTVELAAAESNPDCAHGNMRLQVYYRAKTEYYREERSVEVKLHCGRHTYHVPLPRGPCGQMLRLDPGDSEGEYQLLHLELRAVGHGPG